jgi:hypothetical protein
MIFLETVQLINESKNEKIPLTTAEYSEVKEKFGSNRGCSFAKDKKGYYCYTHRARCKSYENIKDIPMKTYKFICSTG